MQVNSIQSNEQNFGARFVKNDNFCRMIRESSKYNSFDDETLAVIKDFSKKNKEHELIIDNFELIKENDGRAFYDVKVLNTGINFDFGGMHLDAINQEGRYYQEFPLKTFLKKLLSPEWSGLFKYDEKYDVAIHDLLGTRTTLK